MNEAQLYDGFNGEWFKDVSEYFVGKKSAVDFVIYSLKQNVRILGIEGFVIRAGAATPVLSAIADYSTSSPSWNDLNNFMTSTTNVVTHFNFVLEVK
jgi:hypothetical protein